MLKTHFKSNLKNKTEDFDTLFHKEKRSIENDIDKISVKIKNDPEYSTFFFANCKPKTVKFVDDSEYQECQESDDSEDYDFENYNFDDTYIPSSLSLETVFENLDLVQNYLYSPICILNSIDNIRLFNIDSLTGFQILVEGTYKLKYTFNLNSDNNFNIGIFKNLENEMYNMQNLLISNSYQTSFLEQITFEFEVYLNFEDVIYLTFYSDQFTEIILLENGNISLELLL